MNTDNRDIASNSEDVAKVKAEFERERIVHFKREERGRGLLRSMEEVLQQMRDAKPSGRNELGRRFSVAITEYEKSLAFFKFYVVDQG